MKIQCQVVRVSNSRVSCWSALLKLGLITPASATNKKCMVVNCKCHFFTQHAVNVSGEFFQQIASGCVCNASPGSPAYMLLQSVRFKLVHKKEAKI